MFRIFTLTGKEVGITETISYITYNPRTQCYLSSDEASAEGISLNGKPYGLIGREKLHNALDTVKIRKFDGALEITKLKDENKQLRNNLAETDEATIELYETNLELATITAEQDEAIIQIYEMMEK